MGTPRPSLTAGSSPSPAAGVILSEAQRLERLVADLLDLARLDARRFRLDLRPADVGGIVAAAVEGFGPAAERTGVVLDLDDGSAARVRSSTPIASAQVVANLLDNGCRHAAGRVRVTVAADAGAIVVAVEDDGGGIAPEDLPHVFERLYVSRHQPPRRESGSGLGLAIVRELVAAMGGEVVGRVADHRDGRHPPVGAAAALRLSAGCPPGRRRPR